MNIVTSILGALFGGSTDSEQQTIGALQNQVTTLSAKVKSLTTYLIVTVIALIIAIIFYFRKKATK
ncbi:hypothetical protein GOQ04_14720 [Emticicia sp. ODNR4P]|nr:hypothetical protein [Emticicia sp. ODNR4P]